MKHDSEDRVRRFERLLMSRGVLSAAEMSSLVGVSQATLSRTLAKMDDLVRIGKGRRSRYGLRREIGRWGDHWPVYRVSLEGIPEYAGRLTALHPAEFLLETECDDLRDSLLFAGEFQDGGFPGIPWFLDDLRPQGYLGRIFAQMRGSELRIGQNPELWTNDEAMIAMLAYGADAPGNWIVGTEAIEAFQQSKKEPFVMEAERCGQYQLLADHMVSGQELPGSSAGGEQPKFAIPVQDDDGTFRSVIVKFSGSLNSDSGRRWADLLSLEALASSILSKAGLPAVPTQILEGDERRFLEITRFDRKGRRGRLGVVSLRALCAAFVSDDQPWHLMSTQLEQAGWISPDDAERMRRLYWFGYWIGNTDMHSGNLSFFLSPLPPLSLTPAYDMLPMAYAPERSGDMRRTALEWTPPRPEFAKEAFAMLPWAVEFWRQATERQDLTPEMRRIAGINRDRLSVQCPD